MQLARVALGRGRATGLCRPAARALAHHAASQRPPLLAHGKGSSAPARGLHRRSLAATAQARPQAAPEAEFSFEHQAALVEEDWASKSPYEVLGIEVDATQAEVREAYLRQSKALHPDRAGVAGGGALPAEGAAERLLEVQSAYYVLKTEKLRKEYDECGALAVPQKAWSPRMWNLLKRKTTAEEGTMAPDWGTQEPPLWLIVSGPLSVIFLAMLFSARNDIVDTIKIHIKLRQGAWPCPRCVILNEPDAIVCRECGDERPPIGRNP